MKAIRNIQIKRKNLLLNETFLKYLIFLFSLLPTPIGVPQELQTNLPDNALSALKLELPQTKHLVAIITFVLI